MGLTSISTVLLVLSIQNAPTQEPKPPSLAVSYDRILTDYANGQFGVSVETLRKWHLNDIDEVFDGARADRRWTARLTRAAALIHTEIGAALLRADHRSALGIWHFGVAEQAVQMRALAQDIEFRRDWYLAATVEFHRAKQQAYAREVLTRARRELPESSSLFFASGVVDEAIARLDAPAMEGKPERAINAVHQTRRRFLEDARGHFRSAARLAATDMQIQLHLGRVLALLDDNGALEHLVRAAKAEDVETRFLAALFTGGFHQQRKRLGDAVKWYEEASRLIPGTSPASIALSQALQLTGRSQEARRVLMEATKGAPIKPGFGPWENYPVEVEPDLRKVWAPLLERIDG